MPQYAEKVYGAVISQNEKGKWVVDEAKTEERRREMRKERIRRGRPTKEWMESEREKILKKEAEIQVRHMYASSFALSSRFDQEFRSFWNLPEDWELTEKELEQEMPIFGAKRRK